MKWYQKAIYRAAMAVIPDSIKRQMMGMGRMTVPKNANPWNMFNWLPKKYQTAHTLNLTELKNNTAEELLEILISVHPDIAHAIHTYLRMSDTKLHIKALKQDGTPDDRGQAVIDEIIAMLNTPPDSPGYQVGRSFDKLDTQQRMMVMVRGACAGEIVLDGAVINIMDVAPVDPALIWFKRDRDTFRLTPWQFVRFPKMLPDQIWFGQYKQIDTPTFIYEELDAFVDDPYGRSPILPVLQIVFFHMEVLQDLKAVVHNQGYPRITVKLLEEVMLKNMPAKYKADPNAQRTWMNQRMTDTQTMFSKLNPDDALISFDSVEYGYVDGSGKGPMIDVTKLINVIDTQLATSLKTLLTLLSRHQGSTETYSSVDVQLYIKTVESARNVTARFWERVFSLACRVRGVQTIVEAEYDPIDLRSEQEQETDRQLRLENLESAESNFYITPEEAAEEARKSLGLPPDIPDELKTALQTKQERRLTPPEENPAMPPQQQSNRVSSVADGRSIILSSLPSQSEVVSNDAEQQFMERYLVLMSHIKNNMSHATSSNSLLASMKLGTGIEDQLQSSLWQLYRIEYVATYNDRAIAVGSTRILNPPTDVSVQFRMAASRVITGVSETYASELQSAFEQALDAVKDLPESEQITTLKKKMTEWLDERSAYKSMQIAQHEASIAYHEALFAHDSVHAPETMYSVRPTTTEHEACAEIIAGAPYSLSDARGLTLPLHPNCPHRFVPLEGGE